MGKLSEEASKVILHPVYKRIKIGGPINEHDDDIYRGASDDIVGIIGVGGERYSTKE